MIRTYALRHDINKEKKEKILAVLSSYRNVMGSVSRVQWRLLFSGERFSKMADIKGIVSLLSERYKRNACYQVVSVLSSYLSNRQNDFVKMVYGSSIGEHTTKKLFQINKRKLWFHKEHEKFDSEHLFLARKIFKRILSKNRKVILQKLVTRFLKQQERPYSWANGLLLQNSYFKDYVSQPKAHSNKILLNV